MKTRSDFVSNSSSSSFIVITDSGAEHAVAWQDGVTLPDGELGEVEYGWQVQKYRGFYDKLNWCAIVARDKYDMEKQEDAEDRLTECVRKPWFRFDEMIARLKRVCAGLGMPDVSVDLSSDPYDCDGRHYGYIDHQSSIFEEPRNARMFESDKALRDFLANEGSYIDCSNDNGGRDDDEWDCNTHRYSSDPGDYYKVASGQG